MNDWIELNEPQVQRLTVVFQPLLFAFQAPVVYTVVYNTVVYRLDNTIFHKSLLLESSQ